MAAPRWTVIPAPPCQVANRKSRPTIQVLQPLDRRSQKGDEEPRKKKNADYYCHRAPPIATARYLAAFVRRRTRRETGRRRICLSSARSSQIRPVRPFTSINIVARRCTRPGDGRRSFLFAQDSTLAVRKQRYANVYKRFASICSRLCAQECPTRSFAGIGTPDSGWWHLLSLAAQCQQTAPSPDAII